MNGPIRKVSIVVMVMFLALMLNSTYAYLFRSDSLNANPANRRVRDSQFGTDRGDIMVGNTAIVTSNPVEDQYKFQRTYTQGALYAPVTGYYSFLFGGSGLEKSYSAQLSGTSDAQFLQNLVNAATGKRPKGATLETTLDARAQQAAAKALGDRPGAVVVLDYTTGAVKAMVSSPTFDPNALASHDLSATQDAWTKLNAAEGTPADESGGPRNLSARIDLQARRERRCPRVGDDAGHRSTLSRQADPHRVHLSDVELGGMLLGSHLAARGLAELLQHRLRQRRGPTGRRQAARSGTEVRVRNQAAS